MPKTAAKKQSAKVPAVKKTIAKKKSKNAASKPLGKFIDYDPSTGLFTPVPGARPNNQNTAGVVKRTANYIAKNIPLAQRRDTTRIFVEDAAKKRKLSAMNSGAGLHMGHVRSIDELKHTYVEALNATSSTSLPAAKRKKLANAVHSFADGYISSDAEDSDREMVRKSARVITDPNVAPKKRTDAATFLLKRQNRTTRMLSGADPHTNMVIKSGQDLPTQRNGKVFAYADKRSKLLDSLQDHLGMAHEKILKEKGKALTSTMDYT